MTKTKKNLEVAKNESVALAEHVSDTDYSGMLEQAQYLIDKNLVPPIEGRKAKPEEVVMLVTAGKALGMDPITSVNNIDIIQGGVALRTKVMSGLLARHGIAVKLIRDCEPINEVAYIKDQEGKPVLDAEGRLTIYRDYDGQPKYKKPTNWVTEIEFIRDFGGDIGVVTNRIRFEYQWAVDAGWHTKHTWKKMKAFMMFARCLSRGARAFASDATNGMYDIYEMADSSDKNLDVDAESGEFVYSQQ